MELRRSAEDYLEAILVLKSQKGVVHSIDVAHHLEYSKPSVSRAVNNLKRDGYLEMMEDGELVLTPTGQSAAEHIYERHTILTALFTSIGVDPAIAAEDACRVEHAISNETFDKLKATHNERLRGPAAVAQAADADAKPERKSEGARKDDGDKKDEKKKKKKKKK